MSIAFYNDKDYLYAVFRKQIKGKKITLKYYPGINLYGETWLTDKQRTKNDAINGRIIKMEDAIREVTAENNPLSLTSTQFKKLVEAKLIGKKAATTTFFEFCEIYFQERREKMTYDRAKQIQTAVNILKEYSPNLDFHHIDRKFYREFISFLENRGHSINYIGSIIKNLKRILNYAIENEVTSDTTFQSFQKPSEEVYNVYLTESEIETIHQLKITPEILQTLHQKQREQTKQKKYNITGINLDRQVESLKQAKNLFVVGCWTGLRVENYLSIDPEIQVDLKNGFLHAIANKNGPKLKIPLHRIVREIYKNEGLPGQMSQQKLNEKIKTLGELAGIDEKIIFTRTIGGKRKEFTKLKYEMITSHTARRSFASNLLSRGIPKQYIMAVTGHSTEKSFNKYTQAIQKDILTEKLKGYDVWN